MGNREKKALGQFYTITNPFNTDLFWKWIKTIPNYKKETFLEPFAGANNIVQMLRSLDFRNHWACYDINPGSNSSKAPDVEIQQCDSFQSFPKGFNVVITNPPYLAKNSATKDGVRFPDTHHDDLYKLALEVMLANAGYVAAIIPESFLTQGLFHNRLFGVVSLTCVMFEDTECPVCLALFIPEHCKKGSGEDFLFYKDNIKIGSFLKLQESNLSSMLKNDWKFNMPKGEIGLYALDGTSHKSIRFVAGREIPNENVKKTNRAITRISGLPEGMDVDQVVETANQILESYRDNTNDVFMTAFRGLRKDGDYRRRLNFNQARTLLNIALETVGVE
jgi:hypothetical protein